MAIWQDLRFAVRTLKNSPGFATVAVITLALGIGANTAMFSVVNGVLLRPLDYPNASRMVAVNTAWPQRGKVTPRVTGGDILDIRSGAQAFDHVSFLFGGEIGIQLPDHAEFVGTYFTSPDFFPVFGVDSVAGRAYQESDAGHTAVIGLPFAVRNFGSGVGAIGKVLHVDGQSYEIVGVMPTAFRYPKQAQVWLEVPQKPESMERTAFNYEAVASLKPGVSIEAANAELQTIGARLASAYPDSNKGKSFKVVPLRDQLVGPVRSTLFFLMGAVSLVLLIACANVANLMLARATARNREIAVRSALGASRGAIIRQLLVESAVVAVAGGVLGLLLALAGTRALTGAIGQVGMPRVNDIQINWVVLAFAMAVSLAASFVFGISPAWQASKVDLNDALKQAGRGVAGGSSRLRNGLVVAQIALSFMLAIGAGLLFRSFLALNNVDLGYRTEGMLVMYAHAPAHGLDEYLRTLHFFENVTAQLQQVPGVTSVAAAMGVPTGEYGSNGGYVVDGEDFRSHIGNLAQADFSLSGPGYFSTMGIPLLRGRDFTAGDDYEHPFVAVISESLAKHSFRGQDPVGHTIECGLDSPKWMTIVGVVADVHQDSPSSAPGPQLYMPLLQHPSFANEMQVVMRTAVAPQSLMEPVRQKMHSLSPEVATKFTTMEAMVSDTVATPRFRMLLVSTFAVIALLLAMTGMYGVMSYVTAQRAPEFGVRMALGASPRQVVALVLRRASLLAAIGLGLGCVLALATGKVLSTMLFGLKTTDALTYAGVLIAVTPIVIVAAAVPAWRASRIDPLAALRQE